jgi:hypothetical protein
MEHEDHTRAHIKCLFWAAWIPSTLYRLQGNEELHGCYSWPNIICIWYDIFNCSCVDTRWQQYRTHLHTNSTQNTENGTYITIKRKKCGQCPVFAGYTLAFALQLMKKDGKHQLMPNVIRNCVVGCVNEVVNEYKILATKPGKKTIWIIWVQMGS